MEILISILTVVFGVIGAVFSLVTFTVGVIFTGLIINGVVEELKRRKNTEA